MWTVTILSADSTRDELTAALATVNRAASRCQTIIGSKTQPSPWDNAHAFINGLLDLLVGR